MGLGNIPREISSEPRNSATFPTLPRRPYTLVLRCMPPPPPPAPPARAAAAAAAVGDGLPLGLAFPSNPALLGLGLTGVGFPCFLAFPPADPFDVAEPRRFFSFVDAPLPGFPLAAAGCIGSWPRNTGSLRVRWKAFAAEPPENVPCGVVPAKLYIRTYIRKQSPQIRTA